MSIRTLSIMLIGRIGIRLTIGRSPSGSLSVVAGIASRRRASWRGLSVALLVAFVAGCASEVIVEACPAGGRNLCLEAEEKIQGRCGSTLTWTLGDRPCDTFSSCEAACVAEETSCRTLEEYNSTAGIDDTSPLYTCLAACGRDAVEGARCPSDVGSGFVSICEEASARAAACGTPTPWRIDPYQCGVFPSCMSACVTSPATPCSEIRDFYSTSNVGVGQDTWLGRCLDVCAVDHLGHHLGDEDGAHRDRRRPDDGGEAPRPRPASTEWRSITYVAFGVTRAGNN